MKSKSMTRPDPTRPFVKLLKNKWHRDARRHFPWLQRHRLFVKKMQAGKDCFVTRPDIPLTVNFTWRFRWTKRCTITARRSRSTCTFKTTPTNRSRKSKSLSDSSQTSAYSPQHSTSAQSQKWKASKHGFLDAFPQPKPCLFLKFHWTSLWFNQNHSKPL